MLENQLELQAAEMERIEVITTELRGVAATSCISCDTRPPPCDISGQVPCITINYSGPFISKTHRSVWPTFPFFTYAAFVFLIQT